MMGRRETIFERRRNATEVSEKKTRELRPSRTVTKPGNGAVGRAVPRCLCYAGRFGAGVFAHEGRVVVNRGWALVTPLGCGPRRAELGAHPQCQKRPRAEDRDVDRSRILTAGSGTR